MNSKLNCVSCGKFTSRTTDGAVCPKCDSVTHRTCAAGIGMRAKVHSSWRCAACQANAPKGRDPSTPVRSSQDAFNDQGLPETSVEPVTLAIDHHIAAEVPDAEMQLNLRPLKEEFTADVMKMHEAYMTELKSFRGEFRSHCSEMQELKAELSTLRATVEACTERAAEVERRMANLEQAQVQKEDDSTIQEFVRTIADLKTELNDREQEAFLNDVEVSGIPEEKGENPHHLVSVLGAAMGMKLDERDIVSAERVGALARPQSGEASSQATVKTRRIVVRFARRSIHDEYLRAARVRRGLTSSDVGVSSAPPVRVYVNERLSRGNRHLFAKAREASRRHQWKYCWTKAGRIHVRRELGSVVMRIRSEKDLERVFGTLSV